MNVESDQRERRTRLSSQRMAEYARVIAMVGNTPLVQIKEIPIPNGNRIYAKEEWRNPTGSIFDRLYPEVIMVREVEGLIVPGITEVVEASTGNAGASCAWATKKLNYPATIFIHEDAPHARIAQIISYGANVNLAPAGEYAKGYVRKLEEYLEEKGRLVRGQDGRLRMIVHNPDLPFPITKIRPEQAAGYHRLANEAYQQLREREGEDAHFDVAIFALGSGTSSKEIGRRLREIYPCIMIIGIEPEEAPTATNLREGRVLDFARMPHRMWGSGAFGLPRRRMNFDFDNLDDIRLCGEREWRPILELLHQEEGHPVGYTGAANVAIALQVAQEFTGKRIFTVYSDHIGKYGDDYVPPSFKGVVV